VADLETALRKCGLRDGMVISNHHHLRDGDKVALMALEAAARIGVKDLMWFPSASFPSQKGAIELMEKGVIHHIEGSMNGPLGDYCTQGKMRGMGVLRSHGGRYQAIQDGEVHIDVAVIAAPTADFFGNADGSHGKSACGSLGFALADSIYADRVIVVTDNLVPFPCMCPGRFRATTWTLWWKWNRLAIRRRSFPARRRLRARRTGLRIAELVAQFLREAGIMKNGFSFQAGAGGIALAFVEYLRR
jgi:citrate lyase subunit alpha / citrate CoA-transferase